MATLFEIFKKLLNKNASFDIFSFGKPNIFKTTCFHYIMKSSELTLKNNISSKTEAFLPKNYYLIQGTQKSTGLWAVAHL